MGLARIDNPAYSFSGLLTAAPHRKKKTSQSGSRNRYRPIEEEAQMAGPTSRQTELNRIVWSGCRLLLWGDDHSRSCATYRFRLLSNEIADKRGIVMDFADSVAVGDFETGRYISAMFIKLFARETAGRRVSLNNNPYHPEHGLYGHARCENIVR